MSTRGLWDIQTDSIIDVRFGDADVETYKTEGMDTLLPRWDNINKDKQSRSSSRWDFHFHSYVITIYVRLY